MAFRPAAVVTIWLVHEHRLVWSSWALLLIPTRRLEAATITMTNITPQTWVIPAPTVITLDTGPQSMFSLWLPRNIEIPAIQQRSEPSMPSSRKQGTEATPHRRQISMTIRPAWLYRHPRHHIFALSSSQAAAIALRVLFR